MNGNIPSVSLILPTLNRPHLLARMLDSVEAHGKGVTLEVVVVDQSGDDRTRVLCASRKVTCLSLSEKGASRARNRGAEVSSHSWLAFSDDDAVLAPGWGMALGQAVSSPNVAELFAGNIRTLETGAPFVPGGPSRREPLTVTTALATAGPSLTLTRDLFHRLGGFDEALGPGAHWGTAEDIDLVVRAVLMGASCVFEPEIQVLHPAYNWEDLESLDKLRRYSLGHGAFLRKNLMGPEGWRLLPTAARMLLGPMLAWMRAGQNGEKRQFEVTTLLGRWEAFLTYSSRRGGRR